MVSSSPQQLESSIVINAPAALAYTLWSDCKNFPQFLQGVQEVRKVGPQRLHWRAEIWGENVEWEAEILEDIPNTRIAWRTLTGERITGTVLFVELGFQSVRVTHTLELGEANGDTSGITIRLGQDLERFKDFVESQNRLRGGLAG